MAKLLTGIGTAYEHQITPALKQILAYLDDGTLYVAKAYQFDPSVTSFKALVRRLGHVCRTELVDIATIRELYEHDGYVTERGYTALSDMQQEATNLFKLAVQRRASDIHIRVKGEYGVRIYFRVHNDLEFVRDAPYDWGVQLCSTIYQSMSDVSDTVFQIHSRQDARISEKRKIPEGLNGIRIATTPQVDGNAMVLRLLYDDAAGNNDLRKLGYDETQNKLLTLLRRIPIGLNIIAGPTGSGKSTTLQRVLTIINEETNGKKHIITCEDPPEYPIPGAVQTPVANADTEEERVVAFQQAIKAAMRLDPDVLMIGEVRDRPSAKLSVQAAMTGHQVWATVHANSALAILDRMRDLGVEKELIYDHTIISGLICQRLLKTICPHCKQALIDVLDRYDRESLERVMRIGSIEDIYVLGSGCEKCNNTGIAGRSACSEIIKTDSQLMQLLAAGQRTEAYRYWKDELNGMSMLDSAIAKIRTGEVDPFMAEDVVGPLNMFNVHAPKSSSFSTSILGNTSFVKHGNELADLAH